MNRVLEQVHASYIETVPFRHIAGFTIFEFLFLLLCFGVTWIPIAGILFPLPFFFLILVRQHVLPKIILPQYLRELDAAEYEEILGAPQGNGEVEEEIGDADILDQLTTNRGEVKVRTVSFNEDRNFQVRTIIIHLLPGFFPFDEF